MSTEEDQTAQKNAEPYEPAGILQAPVEHRQEEMQNLKPKQKKVNVTQTGRIGIAFAVPGVLALAFSVLANSQVLAFIGLGLTLWGAIFFLISPVEYVKGSLLDATAAPSYQTVDRMLKDLKPMGKSYYIPPYPKDVYLPEHLKGLKESIVFIPTGTRALNTTMTPSIVEIATGKFIIQHPKGICITSPGLGLLTQFEKEIRTDLPRIGLEELCETLPQIILENFQLAKEMEMRPEKNEVHLTITDSIYKGLYREDNLKSVQTLGCPLVSAIASAIAKTTGKPVTIQSLSVSPDAQTIEVAYQITEG